jgi:hypothetical protein
MDADHIDAVFEYLDWCKEQGMGHEDTKKRENIMRFGLERHRSGKPFDGLHIALCKGTVTGR